MKYQYTLHKILCNHEISLVFPIFTSKFVFPSRYNQKKKKREICWTKHIFFIVVQIAATTIGVLETDGMLKSASTI